MIAYTLLLTSGLGVMEIEPGQLPSSEDILVIDDSVENLKFLLEVLTESGYRVRTANDGELALRSIKAKQPTLILLDLRMPGLDGFDVCRYLKADEAKLDIPIIIISSSTDFFSKAKGFELGAVDYVTKPLNAQEVLLRIVTHLKLFNIQQQLKMQNLHLLKAKEQSECANRKLMQTEQVLADYINNLEQIVLERTVALEKANLTLMYLCEHDELTGISNRRKFDAISQAEWQHTQNLHLSLSLIMIDIDWFKAYNDHYGHQAGDHCLHQVAQAIEATIQRSTDLVARYGGEEFVVILPGTDAINARQLAEEVRRSVQALNIPHVGNPSYSVVTISLGVATCIPDLQHDFSALLNEADANLYQAKQQGRNQVV